MCWGSLLRVPWTARRSNQSIPKEVNPKYSLEGLKLQYFGHLMQKPNSGKDWRQEEKGTTEDEMVGWYHRLNGHEFEQTVGDGEGQGSLGCYSSWGPKELDTTERLNNKLYYTCLANVNSQTTPCYSLFILSLIINNNIIWILLIKKLRHREVKELLKVTQLLTGRVRPWN